VKPAARAASAVAVVCGSSKSAGTVITARSGATPSCCRTSSRRALSTSAESSSGRSERFAAGKSTAWAVPRSRLNSPRTFSGSPSRSRRARSPTVTRPRASRRTTEGVMLLPSALRTTESVVPSNTAAAELVVPRSIPRKMGFEDMRARE